MASALLNGLQARLW